MLLTGDIPLVGITSSHTWLHQGPLWTYILAIILWISDFDPLVPGYIMAVFGTITVIYMYWVLSRMFDRTTGLIASALLSVSVYAVIFARQPYHTSPITFFVIMLLYSTWKWLQGNVNFFPLVLLSLTILYHFELASALFWPVFVLIMLYGAFTKKKWVTHLKNRRVIVLSLVAFIVPMLPIFIYDVYNGFPQTFKFALWIPYKILSFFNPANLQSGGDKLPQVVEFFLSFCKRIILYPSALFSLAVYILGVGYTTYRGISDYRKHKTFSPYTILAAFTILPLIGFFINMTVSDAYMPLLIPQSLACIAVLFSALTQTTPGKIGIPVLVLVIMAVNSNILVTNDFFASRRVGSDFSYAARLSAARGIVEMAHGRRFNIENGGPGSDVENYLMNHEYLTWWLGNGPIEDPAEVRFIIFERKNDMLIQYKGPKKE
jgi:4-amino-4-deoxy-L-arabinose transferase-like glycosyltransferase